MPFLAQDEHLQACFRDLSLRVATLPLPPGRDRWLNWLLEQGWGARKGISEDLQGPRCTDALNHTLASQYSMGGSGPGNLKKNFCDGALELSDGPGYTGCYSLSDLAAGQMCQRLGIPVGESIVASSRFTMIQID